MSIASVEDFQAEVDRIRSRPTHRDPAAWGLGLATVTHARAQAPLKVLDTWFPVPNMNENTAAAAIIADAVGHDGATSASYPLDAAHLADLAGRFAPFTGAVHEHPNVGAVLALTQAIATPPPHLPGERIAVVCFLDALDAAPIDAHDAYLRLHLLSSRKVRPHGLNLDGMFGLLSNVVWTNLGPFDPDTFDADRLGLRAQGVEVSVHGYDKFPRMLDYVTPSGVRVADANRVRLGAHLAAGTTVMHEGFVNFNAGTLGASMVEGRISAGVVVGDGSDIGGGASIMGTLSGGGKEVISIGEASLLGANAGIGISLGNRCTVEAGLYVTAGTKVVWTPDGSVVRARELSGADDLLFRRNSTTGAVEVVPTGGAADGASPSWGGLNAQLHAND